MNHIYANTDHKNNYTLPNNHMLNLDEVLGMAAHKLLSRCRFLD